MKAVAIFYFSGTGNTEIVAQLIQAEFTRQQIAVDIFRIEDILKSKKNPTLAHYDLIGIGSPVIGFGTPKIVHQFVQTLPECTGRTGTKVFIFKTAGGVSAPNYNASKPTIRKLAKKGYQVFYERIFAISCNWAIKYADNTTRKLYEVTKRKVEIMCQELLAGKERIYKTGFGLKLAMEIFMAMVPFFMSRVGKDYYVNRFCNDCSLCIRHCPMENIYQKKAKIKFKNKCLSCMRCVYSCPMHAINLKLWAFFIIRGGFDLRKILSKPADEQTLSADPWFPHFKSYLENDDV